MKRENKIKSTINDLDNYLVITQESCNGLYLDIGQI